jgi:DNA replication initiation complex subunit (GINS family)
MRSIMEDQGKKPEVLSKSLFQEIQDMNVSEKLDFARKCSKEARIILIRDANKLVQMAVITSPKMTDSEVLAIANNRQVNEDVLRFIADHREWMKNYQVKAALVNNPKTPLPLALKLISALNQKDLSLIAKSKAVPRALVIAAQRRLKEVKV